MVAIYVSLSIFAGLLGGMFLLVLMRSWFMTRPGDAPLKGLALPEGSVRGLLAFLVVGSFIIFIFFGEAAVTDENFKTILTAFGTLTGAVTGFYFGTRGAQQEAKPPEKNDTPPSQPQPGGPGTPR